MQQQPAKKMFPRHPTKKELEKTMRNYGTMDTFQEVLEWKRGGEMHKAPMRVQRYDAAMRMYFQKHALRAPQMPPKMRDADTGGELRTLYRGVAFDGDLADMIFSQTHLNDEYMSFSRSRQTAMGYALFNLKRSDRMVLFRLDLSAVPRGTPWVWYHGGPGRPTNKSVVGPSVHDIDGGSSSNYEVLLPPGDLKFLSKPVGSVFEIPLPGGRGMIRKHLTTVDVAYRPFSEEASWVALKAALKLRKKGWGASILAQKPAILARQRFPASRR